MRKATSRSHEPFRFFVSRPRTIPCWSFAFESDIERAVEERVSTRCPVRVLCRMVNQEDRRTVFRQSASDGDNAGHPFGLVRFETGKRHRESVDNDQRRPILGDGAAKFGEIQGAVR